MSEDKTFAMPEHYNVTVAAFKRFERRSGVQFFAVLADAIREAGKEAGKAAEAVGGIALAKAVFTDSESLAAFIYECGFDEEQRKAVSFEDWLKCVTIGELFGEYDKAIMALFTSSPSQKTETREAGKEKAATKKAETKAEVTP